MRRRMWRRRLGYDTHGIVPCFSARSSSTLQAAGSRGAVAMDELLYKEANRVGPPA
jgi:hypothetical protein